MAPLPSKPHIVLLGGGHSHVGVLRAWGLNPPPGLRVTLVSSQLQAPYSGMLPGFVAGHHRLEETQIPLQPLAAFAGAEFIQAEIVALERNARGGGGHLIPSEGHPIPYDLLSVNTGSRPHIGAVPGAADHAVPVKPIEGFHRHWLSLLHRVQKRATDATPSAPLSLVVVGGGAGGVELVLSAQYRLRHAALPLGQNPASLQFSLITADEAILPTHNARVRRRFTRLLASRGIQLLAGQRVTAIGKGYVRLEATGAPGATCMPADEVLWVTQAVGPTWLAGSGLALDERGFIRVTRHLQSVNDPCVFAAGDVCSLQDHPLQKAGVFAVRMGPVLAHNLPAAARGWPLKAYRPQARWLALISTGDRQAVASWGPLSWAGPWVWRWKQAIDRRFIRRYQSLPPRKASSVVS